MPLMTSVPSGYSIAGPPSGLLSVSPVESFVHSILKFWRIVFRVPSEYVQTRIVPELWTWIGKPQPSSVRVRSQGVVSCVGPSAAAVGARPSASSATMQNRFISPPLSPRSVRSIRRF